MFELNTDQDAAELGDSSTKTEKLVYEKLMPKTTVYHQRKSYATRESIADLVENNSYYQIASLIPDEILSKSESYAPRKFEGVVFFADISGFTDLSEKYQNVENGASKLSAVLNFYLGIMVQEILSHNGDIIKYAGDAFLAVFRNENWKSIQNNIHSAIDTAIIIQKSCRNFRTEIGVTLNVKIAISCGVLDFQIIGGESSSHYVCIGEPVWQTKALQEFISPEEILLTWRAWYYTQDSLYEYQLMKEQRCYKITGFKEQISLLRRQYEANQNYQELHKTFTKSMDVTSASNVFLEGKFSPVNLVINQNEIFSLRQKIGLITSNETRKSLRRFVIKPLLNAIDMGDNIESLTEMRNVVIVFVNIVVPFKDSANILLVTDKIYKTLFKIVNSYEGVVNKVSLFDKDMMFLNIFGLKGFQHENDSEIGLRCAQELFETLSRWKEITTVSIGVTTGKSYCGVVGHALRREYSVISVTVNRAARLMVAYKDMVSCDQETLMASKLSLDYFKLLPMKKLKGISEALSVYKYSENNDGFSYINLNENEILYGRDDLIKQILKDISAAIQNSNNANDNIQDNKQCFIITGESGEGKSKILNHLLASVIQKGTNCILLKPKTKHFSKPFWTLRRFLLKTIDVEYSTIDKYLNVIKKIFEEHNIQQYLFLLNEILKVKVDEIRAEVEQNDEQMNAIQRKMIAILGSKLKNYWVLLIDDADLIDLKSLVLINSIMDSQKVCLVLSIGKNNKKWLLQHGKFIATKFITQYNLLPIDKTFHKDIACQSINVSAITIDFERFIQKNSNGNPRWLEVCAKTLLYSGILKIKRISFFRAMNSGMIIGNMSTNTKGGNFFDLQPIINSSQKNEEMIDVAIIDGLLSEKDLYDSYKSNKLLVYDTLSSSDQMICKCASVIGVKFSRMQLNYLLPKGDLRMISKIIAKLFKLKIIFCSFEKVGDYCNCKTVEIFESTRDLPRYANCTLMTFNDEKFRQYIYDALTEKQKHEYHKKCIAYLCRKTKRCSSCSSKTSFAPIRELILKFRDGYNQHRPDEPNKNEALLRNVIPIEKLKRDKISRKIPIVLNFMSYEYNNCKCNFLLSNTFYDIVRHCQGNDMLLQKAFSQVVSSDLSLQIGSVPNCFHFLESTLKILNKISKNGQSLFPIYLIGKTLTLKGNIHEAIEQYPDAFNFYYKACSVFKVDFPRKYNPMTTVKKFIMIQEIKRNIGRERNNKLTRIQLMIVNQTITILQRMYNCFLKTNQNDLAELAAIWALRDALKSEVELSCLALCFCNMLKLRTKIFEASVEKKIFSEIFKASHSENIDKPSLENIVQLYVAVMEYLIFKQNYQFALSIGDIAKKICYNIGSHEALLKIIPVLFILCMKKCRIEECFKMLQELHYSIKMNNDTRELKVYFYALCIDLTLTTNIIGLLDFDTCLAIYNDMNLRKQYSEISLLYNMNFRLWSFQQGVHIDWNQGEFSKIEIFLLNHIQSFMEHYICTKLYLVLTFELRRSREFGDFDKFQKFWKLITKCQGLLRKLNVID